MCWLKKLNCFFKVPLNVCIESHLSQKCVYHLRQTDQCTYAPLIVESLPTESRSCYKQHLIPSSVLLCALNQQCVCVCMCMCVGVWVCVFVLATQGRHQDALALVLLLFLFVCFSPPTAEESTIEAILVLDFSLILKSPWRGLT